MNLAALQKGVFKLNRRQRTIITSVALAIFMVFVIGGGILTSKESINTHLEARNLAPSIEHPFGTDWLGRDMFIRTLKGLTLSIGVGLLSAIGSVLVALIFGMAAASLGKACDSIITWIIDLALGLPHLIALILIAFCLGGGLQGVVIGVALTHWTSLTRVIRAEILQVRTAEYVEISGHLGKTPTWVAFRHILPHLVPQLFVGFVLIFPHAILHEASITFLGFGLSPHQPAIGIILSESMRYLSIGKWWLAFFPGLSLLILVRAFDLLCDNIRMLTDPRRAQE